jgi:hypothetical protein
MSMNDVALELLAEFEGELGAPCDGLRVVAVDVEDRRLDHLGDVGAVAGRAGVGGVGGEADLVVDDDVDGAAGAIAGKLREIEGLGDDALAGEGGVAVDEEREDACGAPRVAADALAGAGLALDHGVDDLEVDGLAARRTSTSFARGRLASRLVAEVVFHVAVAADRVGDVILGELLEELVEGLAQDAAEDVEAAAVGHAHDDLLDAASGQWSMTASSAAMIVSPPSREKRFWPTYLVWRNFSKSSALCTWRRIRTFCGA